MVADDAARSRRVAAAAATAAARARDAPTAFRGAADAYDALRLPGAARFLADKAAATSRSPEDALRLARVHVGAGQHRRALHVLAAAGLGAAGGGSLTARLLAAQCEFAVGEIEACLAVLGEDEAGDEVSVEGGGGDVGRFGATADGPEVRAALAVMRGRVYEAMENVERAAWWYKRALVCDVFCYEAFERLVDTGLASPDDAARFAEDLRLGRGANTALWDPPRSAAAAAATNAAGIVATPSPARTSLRRSSTPAAATAAHPSPPPATPAAPATPATPPPPSLKHSALQQMAGADARAWMCAYYRVRADRGAPLPPAPGAAAEAGGDGVPGTPTSGPRTAAEVVVADPRMRENADVLAVRAVRLFAALDFEECAALTRDVLERDPYVEDRVLVVHLAALVELDERHELFVLAHSLVDNRPRDAVSWMAVGYYYFACGKLMLSRRYLQKATSINPRLGPAWLAFGHAFAAQDESDQAMAAYRTASRLFPGDQLPLLFMGMEYARQCSLVHATSFCQTAREACPTDPAPRHELGVIAYRSGDLQGAVAYFKAAISLWETSDGLRDFVLRGGRRAEAEEATLFNLGHCYRRMRDFERAKRCYERSLSLRPRSASTCAALGMTLHALGDPSAAVALYHRALRYNPDDTIAVAGLDRALTDMTIPIPDG